MSVWRRKAIEACPELQKDLELSTSCMLAWFDLLPVVREHERAGDVASVMPIYSFARWCWDQPEHQNTVAVGFYEHLVDEIHTRQVLPKRMNDSAQFAALITLFESRLSKQELQTLLKAYDTMHKTRFARDRA